MPKYFDDPLFIWRIFFRCFLWFVSEIHQLPKLYVADPTIGRAPEGNWPKLVEGERVKKGTVDSWWFRNPVNSPVEIGSWNPIIYRDFLCFIHPRWLFGIPSINGMLLNTLSKTNGWTLRLMVWKMNRISTMEIFGVVVICFVCLYILISYIYLYIYIRIYIYIYSIHTLLDTYSQRCLQHGLITVSVFFFWGEGSRFPSQPQKLRP